MRKSTFVSIVFTLGVVDLGAAGVSQGDVVTVDAKAGPWLWNTSGLNSSYAYGQNDQLMPTVVQVTAGEQVSEAYLSGTTSWEPGRSGYTASGDTTYLDDNFNGAGYGFYPSYYMSPALYPIYQVELVGTYADSNGDVLGTPFPIGLGSS